MLVFFLLGVTLAPQIFELYFSLFHLMYFKVFLEGPSVAQALLRSLFFSVCNCFLIFLHLCLVSLWPEDTLYMVSFSFYYFLTHESASPNSGITGMSHRLAHFGHFCRDPGSCLILVLQLASFDHILARKMKAPPHN